MILLLASPILTRIYSPEQFGVLATYIALVGIIVAVAGLSYELAIPLPLSDQKAIAVLAVTLISVAGITALTVILVAVFNERMADWTNTPGLRIYLWLLPAGVAVGGTHQALTQWAMRTKAFNRLSLTQVQQGGAIAVSQIGLGVAHLGSLGLIVGHMIGVSTSLAGLYRTFRVQEKPQTSTTSLADVTRAAKRYQRFPAYASGAALVNAVGNQMPPLALAVFFSPAAAGFYIIAQRVGSRPLQVVGNSVRNVFFPDAAVAKQEGRLDEITSKAFRGLLRVGTLPIGVLAFIAPDLFAVVFGPEWAEAGFYLRWLAPWFAAQFVVSPLVGIFYVMECQTHVLVLQGILLGVRLLSFALGIYFHSVVLALVLFGLSSAAAFALFGVSALHLAGVDFREPGRNLLEECFIAGVVLAFMALTLHFTAWRFPEVTAGVQVLSAICIAIPAMVWRVWQAMHRPAADGVG